MMQMCTCVFKHSLLHESELNQTQLKVSLPNFLISIFVGNDKDFKFDGRRNLSSFISTASEVGLWVILRPGPFVAAERNGGGIPYWVYAKEPDVVTRYNRGKSCGFLWLFCGFF